MQKGKSHSHTQNRPQKIGSTGKSFVILNSQRVFMFSSVLSRYCLHHNVIRHMSVEADSGVRKIRNN